MTKEESDKMPDTPECCDDLNIIKRELKDFEDEHNVLSRNPQQNKVRLYFLDAHISQRKQLISRIEDVLKFRGII